MSDYSVFGPFAGAAFAGADRARDETMRRKTQNALSGFSSNPDAAINNYMAVDAPNAIKLRQDTDNANAENTQRRALAAKAISDAAGERQKLALSALSTATTQLRVLRDKGGDVGAGFDQLDQAGVLDTLGMSPQEKAQYRAAITTNPAILDAIAARVPEGVVIDHNLVDKNSGDIMRTVPRAPEFKIIPNGTGGSSYGVYDPNTGGFGNGVGPSPAIGGAASPAPTGGGRSQGDPYNTVLGNGRFGTPPAPLTSMTLGQVFDFGRNTLIPNSKAAGIGKDERGTIGSSASGAYQITGETLSRVAPAVLGPNWRDQQFTPQAQDALGEAVYNDAVARGVPLNKVWASLSPAQAKILAGRPWAQVRDIIIKSETGGAPAAAPQSAAPSVPGFTILGQTAPKPAKPSPTRMTPEEVKAEGLDPSIVYYRGADGVPSAVSGQTKPSAQLKPWPQVSLKSYSENQASIKNIDNALKLLDPNNNSPEAKAARGATGFGTGALGDYFTNNISDPQGTKFRALIGQIGGVIIKDISGAAVSATEDARLAKWVPSVSDSPKTIRDKLDNLKREIEQRNGAMEDTYTEDQGYRPRTGGASAPGAAAASGQPVKVRTMQQALALPPGTIFIDPYGRRKVR